MKTKLLSKDLLAFLRKETNQNSEQKETTQTNPNKSVNNVVGHVIPTSVQSIIDEAMPFLEPKEENLSIELFPDEVHRMVMKRKFYATFEFSRLRKFIFQTQ